MGFTDSHCHLQERYAPAQSDGGVTGALTRARDAGIDRLVCVGTDAATSAQAIALASAVAGGDFGAAVPKVYAAVGLHPHDATLGTATIAPLLAQKSPHVVAVGECGLDYHYEHSPRTVQREVFAQQIALAHEEDLALVIHARDAWDDLFSVLESEGVPARTVLHCFTGGLRELERCLGASMFVSFSGVVTFKNATETMEAARACPLESLLIETDSPFLAPVPHRGKPNEPALLSVVAAAIATTREISVDALATSSTEAAARAFGLVD